MVAILNIYIYIYIFSLVTKVPIFFQVTLELVKPTTVNIYDIYSTTANDQAPLPPLSTVTSSSVPFMMSDKAVVLHFAAPLTTRSPRSSPSSAAPVFAQSFSVAICNALKRWVQVLLEINS